MQAEAYNFIKKETMAQVLFCKFCEISKNTFFTEHLWVNASEYIVAMKGRMNKEEISSSNSSSSNNNVDKIKSGATNLPGSHHQNYNTVVSWDVLNEHLTNNTVNRQTHFTDKVKC